jgi:transcriptional regulator with XRE-family HTH domain
VETQETGAQAGLILAIAAALRRERGRLGLSLTELARRAGIAKSTLSQLESGNGNPSVETLWALSNALLIPFSALIEPPASDVRVIRADEGAVTRSEHTSYTAKLLACSPVGARTDIYQVRMTKGSPKSSRPHMPGTSEHVVIGSGRALIGPAEAPVELGPGDYIRYPGDVPHYFEALEPVAIGVLVMELAT